MNIVLGHLFQPAIAAELQMGFKRYLLKK